MIRCWGWDPGLQTGWCHISVHEDGEIGIFSSGEADHNGIGNLLYDNPVLKAAVSKRDVFETVFVVEKFIMNSKITQAPWSLETTGLIRYFASFYNVPMEVVVSPSSHKNLVKDDIIKRAGLWVPGKEHANDAVRMSLWYLMTKRKLLTEFLKR